MGLDMMLQALPDNEEWWNHVLAQDAIRESLSLLPSVMHQARHLPTTGELGELATQLIAAHPGIEQRNCNLDHMWDLFAYLLSGQRRSLVDDEDVDISDLGLLAVRGEHAVGWDGNEICGFQGIPIGFTTAPTVAKIARFLEPIEEEELGRPFDPSAMKKAEIYKHPDAADWRVIKETFHHLQQFYRDAAAHGEGVLICLD